MQRRPDKGKERRSEHRLSFEGVIRGRIRHTKGELDFEAFDISKRGLGLYLNPCPDEGEEIALDLSANQRSRPLSLHFTVKHIYSETQAGKRRCGIELVPSEAEQVDLIEVITRYI